MEKFYKLKIGASLFNNFYSKFICLALGLEYIFEIFIQEFQHKLSLCLQNWLNSEVKHTKITKTEKKNLIWKFIIKDFVNIYNQPT